MRPHEGTIYRLPMADFHQMRIAGKVHRQARHARGNSGSLQRHHREIRPHRRGPVPDRDLDAVFLLASALG